MVGEQEQGRQKRALIIGISDYNDSSLERLDFCEKDGLEVYEVLAGSEYNFSEIKRIVGRTDWDTLYNAIHDFFGNEKRPVQSDDTLLFYYSGHGVLGPGGKMYLASSDVNTDEPSRKGFSLETLIDLMNTCHSQKVVTILDCCYSGAANLGKGSADDAAKLGRKAVDDSSRGQGRYILSASQAARQAFGSKTKEHSLFTYYLLEGLKGKPDCVDRKGNVTPLVLGKFVYRKLIDLPIAKRLKQTPVIKTEGSEDVILGSHPELREIVIEPESEPKEHHPKPKEIRKYVRNNYKLLISILVATVVGMVIVAYALYDSQNGFSYGTAAAMNDLQNKKLFDPSCDPTLTYIGVDGQHSVKFCVDWTNGYISAWNSEHPGWTNGYISAWKPSHPPPKEMKLSCQGCATQSLTPITRYINGTTDGSKAALSDIQEGKQFNPGCDPTNLHGGGDARHSPYYCNGWTNGYISAWNSEHTPQSKQINNPKQAGQTIPSNINQNISHLSNQGNNSTTRKKLLPTFTHLDLICQNKSNRTLNCSYINGTYSQLPIK